MSSSTNVETSNEQKTISEYSKTFMELSVILPLLTKMIQKRLVAYHSMFSLPLIAEHWEETLHRSFKDIGYDTTWLPNRSHAIGEDMRLKWNGETLNGSRISCKSGQFITPRALGKKCVKWNGSRSTKYPTLQEKINHFCGDHDDLYFLLAKNKPFNKQYKLIVFPSSLVKVDQLNWCESKSGKEYKGTPIEGNTQFMATIGKSMSAQLWTTFPLENIPYIFDIDCN